VLPDHAERQFDADAQLIQYPGQRETSGALVEQERCLTQEDRQALIDYGGDTEAGRELNQGLRDGTIDPATSTACSRLDAAFKADLPEDTVLYRGIHATDQDHAFLNPAVLEPGQQITDPAYQSASPDLTPAENYAREVPDGYAAVAEIHCPQGSRVAYLDYYNEHGETETLLPRGSTVEYEGSYQDDHGIDHLHFRLI